MNIIYLYLHQIMMRYSTNNIITRKQALYVISRHFKFANNINKNLRNGMRKIVERNMLKDMCRLKLLEPINPYSTIHYSINKVKRVKNLKIINIDKSANIDKGVLADILTIGGEG